MKSTYYYSTKCIKWTLKAFSGNSCPPDKHLINMKDHILGDFNAREIVPTLKKINSHNAPKVAVHCIFFLTVTDNHFIV